MTLREKLKSVISAWLRKMWPARGNTTKTSIGNSMRKPENKKEPCWLTLAYAEVGVREIPGVRHEKQILLYHKYTKLKAMADEVPWCAAFVNYCLEECGVRGTNSPSARSFMRWGRKLDAPRPGCIVVLWRSNPNSWKGHVGFWVGEDERRDFILGGNQNDSVNVFKFLKKKVLGYYWPNED